MKINPTDLRQVNVFRDASDEDLKLFVEKGVLRSIEEGEFFFFHKQKQKHPNQPNQTHPHPPPPPPPPRNGPGGTLRLHQRVGEQA